MKKLILISLAMLCCAGAKAQYVQSVTVNPDASSVGMANSDIAADATAFSLFGNVAAVSFSDFGLAASYAFNADAGNTMHSVAGYYRLGSKHALALGFRYFGMDEIEVSDYGVLPTVVKPYDAIADFGYAYSINGSLSVGANLRYVNSKLGTDAASAFGFDAGVYYRRNAWSAAMTLNNLGTKVDYGDGGEFMPASLNAGGTYRFDFARHHRLTGNIQAGYRFLPSSDSYFGGGAGLEYLYDEMFAVRGGYRFGDEGGIFARESYATAGCGVYFGPLAIDFAWIFLDGTSDSIWRLSAGVRF